MTPHGEVYVGRWKMENHDGLTEANLEGAVRLGWMTREEANALIESTVE